MLSTKKITEIELICYATVGHMMAVMHNPRYRGAKFTWEDFPEMMASHCEMQVTMSCVMSPKLEQQCLEYAAQFGRDIARRWVKTMTE